MTEQDLIRKWFPDNHDAARAHRMKCDRGQFVNCRHHGKKADRQFRCAKKNSDRVSCIGCNTCPNCDGTLAFYSKSTRHVQDGTHFSMAYTCVHCGAYIEHDFFVRRQAPRKDTRKAGKCEVEGCKNTAYEGHEHIEVTANGPHKWLVCESHYRRVKTWRYNNNKGLEHKPLTFESGKLFDNPNYRKKQIRKDKTHK